MIGGLSFLILIGWTAAMLWGSILAIRGKRSWATSLLMIGSVCMVAGTISAVVATTFLTRAGLGVIAGIVAMLIPIGLLVATIGFIGVCARFGVAEKRAEELEGLVMQLQERVNSGM